MSGCTEHTCPQHGAENRRRPEPTYSPTYQCTRVGCNDVAVQGGLCAMHDKKEGR